MYSGFTENHMYIPKRLKEIDSPYAEMQGGIFMGNLFTQEQLQKLGYYDAQPELEFTEDTIREIFGHEAAEDETIERLKAYYLKTSIYNSMKSQIPLLILVGHKGVGKSALLKVLSSEDNEEEKIPISVQPNDIFNLDVSSNNFLEKIETWKNGLSSIIFNKLVLSINTSLLDKVPSTSFKDWIGRFNELLLNALGKKFEDLQKEKIQLSSSDFTALFKNSLFEEKQITIYLDDLDRGWENTKNDVKNLSAMLNAVRDLSRDIRNLKFRIALRSDVYYAVRTSDETTDKIDGSVIWQSWTNHEILVMLIKRIETYFGRSINEDYLLSQRQRDIGDYLNSVFEERFQGNGQWENAPMYRVLMSLIRKRPRDLVKLCTLAARKAYTNKHSLILTNDLESVFKNYSNDRLTDTSTEYKSELPQVQELLLKMKPSQKELALGTPCLFSRQQLIKKLEDVLSMSHFTFKDGKKVTAQSLAAFLYKINFITARKTVGDEILRVYYDENQYIYNDFADFGYSYEIHPAYRWALQPSNISTLFSEIELLESE